MNEVLAGLIRHALTGVGGVLIAKGYLDSTGLDAVIGALVTIAAVAWSVIAKRIAK